MTLSAEPQRDAPPIGRRALRAVPVLVLTVAILAQAVLTATVNADRQSGSGFAMFSHVDFAGSRVAVVRARTSGGATVEVAFPSSVDGDVDALLIMPTDRRARDLAIALGNFAWTVGGDQATAGGDDMLHSFTVTIRGLRADGRTLSAHALARGEAP